MSAYTAAVLADSPVGYWRLNETSGTTAADSSGNSNPGTYTTTYSLGAASPITTDSTSFALDLSMDSAGGNIGYVDIPDATFLNPTGSALTLECWVKSNPANTAQYGFASMFWKQNTGGTGSWGLQFDTAGVYPFSQMQTSVAGESVTGSTAADTGVWMHVVSVYNGSTFVLYQNAVSVGSTAASGTIVSASGQPLRIGTIPTAASYQLDGYICEVALYSTALSSTRVLAHFNAATTVPPRGLNISQAVKRASYY